MTMCFPQQSGCANNLIISFVRTCGLNLFRARDVIPIGERGEMHGNRRGRASRPHQQPAYYDQQTGKTLATASLRQLNHAHVLSVRCPTLRCVMVAKHGRGSGGGARGSGGGGGGNGNAAATSPRPAGKRRGAPQTFAHKLHKVLQGAEQDKSSPVSWCLEGEDGEKER